MQSIRTYLSVKFTVAALIVGRIVLVVAMLAVVLGLLAWAGRSVVDTHNASTSTATLTTTPVLHAQERAPGLAVHLSEDECIALGMVPTGEGQCVVSTPVRRAIVVAISAPDDLEPHPGVEALIAAGYTGEPGDGLSAVYAPVGEVLFDEHGTWTVTVDGLARCEHGEDRPCSGTEWLR